MKKSLCLLAVVFLCLPIEAKSQQRSSKLRPVRYALLIAVTSYQHAEMNKPKLEYPEVDARSVGTFLKKHGYQVEYLLGSQATRLEIDKKLNELSSKGNEGGVCLVGMWGHGVEFDGTGEAMFCPFDTTLRFAVDAEGKKLFDRVGNRLVEPDPKSLIGMSRVLGGLKLCGASNRLIVADCCRNSPNRPRGRAFGSGVTLSDLPENTAAIFACGRNQFAYEHTAWGHGALTKGLLELLPQMVKRADSSMTSLLNPLRNYVRDLVNEQSNGKDRQIINPVFRGLPDLMLVSNVGNGPGTGSSSDSDSGEHGAGQPQGKRILEPGKAPALTDQVIAQRLPTGTSVTLVLRNGSGGVMLLPAKVVFPRAGGTSFMLEPAPTPRNIRESLTKLGFQEDVSYQVRQLSRNTLLSLNRGKPRLGVTPIGQIIESF